MAFKLMEMAEKRWSWRRINGAHLLLLVRAGVPLHDGEQLEREDTADDQHEQEQDTTERAAA